MSILNRQNMLWEGSRMFLPEHREKLQKYYQQSKEFVPPKLDEQALEEINRVILEGLEGEHPLLIYYVKNKKPQQFCGFIVRIHSHERWLKIANGRITRTIHFDTIYRVEKKVPL